MKLRNRLLESTDGITCHGLTRDLLSMFLLSQALSSYIFIIIFFSIHCHQTFEFMALSAPQHTLRDVERAHANQGNEMEDWTARSRYINCTLTPGNWRILKYPHLSRGTDRHDFHQEQELRTWISRRLSHSRTFTNLYSDHSPAPSGL